MYIDNEMFEKWMEKLYSKICEKSKGNKLSANAEHIFGKDEKLLDNQDLCLNLHVSPRTLQRYRSEGLLPYIKRGQKIYYKASDVREFLNRTGDYWERKRFEDGMKPKDN